MANSQQKKGTPRGGRWTRLQSPGDVARLLRWVILETKEDRVSVTKANCLGQLALCLLKSLEVSVLADRMARIESALEAEDTHVSPSSPVTTH
jgi:hypothetical protein